MTWSPAGSEKPLVYGSHEPPSIRYSVVFTPLPASVADSVKLVVTAKGPSDGEIVVVGGVSSTTTTAETNWKLLVAAVFAAILAIAGTWSAKRRPWRGGMGRRAIAFAFSLTSLPFVAAETATGAVSLATGLLAIPPVWGPGTAIDVGILVSGLIVAFARTRDGAPRQTEASTAP